MSGVKRLVYGLRMAGLGAVETEGGRLIRRPGPPFPADCRGCALIGLVCEELEYPCPGAAEGCAKYTSGARCDECEALDECLSNKPCCWECAHLFDCLEEAREAGAGELVEEHFGCCWDEFVEAIKMLRRSEYEPV